MKGLAWRQRLGELVPAAFWRQYARHLYRLAWGRYRKRLLAYWVHDNLPIAQAVRRLRDSASDAELIFLWAMARQYVREGGRAKHPATPPIVDALLCDLAGRDNTPGPVRDALSRDNALVQAALRAAGTPGTDAWRWFARCESGARPEWA